MNKVKLLKELLDGKTASVFSGVMCSGKSGLSMKVEVSNYAIILHAPSIDRYNKDLVSSRIYEENKHLRDISTKIREGLGDKLKSGAGDVFFEKPIRETYMDLTVPAFSFRLKNVSDVSINYDTDDLINAMCVTLIDHSLEDKFVNKLRVQFTYIKE